MLIVQQSAGDFGTVVERRASSVSTTVDGVLSAGQTVLEAGNWALASGPDGPRTVYGQLRYADGTWSPIGSATITLRQTGQTSAYFDIDDSIVFHDYSTRSDLPDWRARSTTPGDRIYGRGSDRLPPT